MVYRTQKGVIRLIWKKFLCSLLVISSLLLAGCSQNTPSGNANSGENETTSSEVDAEIDMDEAFTDTFTMEEFAASVNEFLAFRRYDILKDKGSVSRKTAKEKAEAEYEAFNKHQKITSDFDRAVKKMMEESGGAE